MESNLDLVVLNFNKDSLLLLNICIAFIMFGVALELKLENFKLLIKTPKPVFVGLASQLILLPLFTLLLIYIINPMPSIALGMLLVAACPGGNVSNFYCSLSKGNVALSVSLTAISSSLSFLLTPFNFAVWASLYEPTAMILDQVQMGLWNVILTVIVILVIPLALGMLFNGKFPLTTLKILKPIKRLSILIFAGFVVAAVSANFQNFIDHIPKIILLVFFHNAIALITGFGLSTIFNVSHADRRSITIETGIQNSGLALVIIFDFFSGMGGMALLAAWWGVWHLISGAVLSFYWSKK